MELGIGTGRIGLPLSRRGVRVHGIDLSEEMVARLRAKPGAEEIEVTMGDFATTRVDESFTLAYLVANTIMNLTTQAEQVACFRNVAAHLEPGGRFVIEVVVPGLQRLPPRRALPALPRQLEPPRLRRIRHRQARSRLAPLLDRRRRGAGTRAPFRYVWPAELDLMAELAGMSLRERFGGWKREPFTSESARHISVWEKP